MILKAFSIRDSKSESFNLPFFKHTNGEAERDFQSAINRTDDNNNLGKYPEDFDLFVIGEMDLNTGLFSSLPTPHHVAKAINLKK